MLNDKDIQAPWIGCNEEEWNERCKIFNEDEEDNHDEGESD